MNISTPLVTEGTVAELFRVIGQPMRVQILLVIGEGEACVCHLEAYLGQRQVAISQQLMVLRDAGLVATQREGRNIYYRLAKPELLNLIRHAATIMGIPAESLDQLAGQPVTPCPCPHCNPEGTGCPQPRVLS